MSTNRNLWPSNIIDPAGGENYPQQVLAFQAQQIQSITHGRLIGRVDTTQLIEDTGRLTPSVIYTLTVSAPKLGGYLLEILQVTQEDIKEYPCKIYSAIAERSFIANSNSELDMYISTVLSSPELKKLINAMYSRSV